MKEVATALTVVLLLAACGTDGGPEGADSTSPPSQQDTPTAPQQPSPTATDAPGSPDGGPPRPQVAGTVARNLSVPWGITFLPDGTALVTERDTTSVLAVPPGGGPVRRVAQLDRARPAGEAGLLGIAASPDFEQDSLVYVYMTTARDNRVVRAEYDGRSLGRPEAVLTGIPKGPIHDGGRLRFGPDGHLYVSTGETGDPGLAQDRGSLAGKILRITPDGQPAPGNPIPDSPVWTLGHRNVEGLAFDDAQRLWASEFGADTWDELNQIVKGDNYGWPRVEGRGGGGFHDPTLQWRPAEASPAGIAYAEGAMWMASLRGERLWRIPLDEHGRTGKPRGFLVGSHGRLRAVVVARDGSLWVSTSNHDGRGSPAPQDDRILRVVLR